MLFDSGVLNLNVVEGCLTMGLIYLIYLMSILASELSSQHIVQSHLIDTDVDTVGESFQFRYRCRYSWGTLLVQIQMQIQLENSFSLDTDLDTVKNLFQFNNRCRYSLRTFLVQIQMQIQLENPLSLYTSIQLETSFRLDKDVHTVREFFYFRYRCRYRQRIILVQKQMQIQLENYFSLDTDVDTVRERFKFNIAKIKN